MRSVLTTLRTSLGACALAAAVLTAPIVPAADTAPIVRATLPNGLRVILVRNTLAPVVATSVNYLVGSDEAPAGFPGTAHAQEHMMFRGSPGAVGRPARGYRQRDGRKFQRQHA